MLKLTNIGLKFCTITIELCMFKKHRILFEKNIQKEHFISRLSRSKNRIQWIHVAGITILKMTVVYILHYSCCLFDDACILNSNRNNICITATVCVWHSSWNDAFHSLVFLGIDGVLLQLLSVDSKKIQKMKGIILLWIFIYNTN